MRMETASVVLRDFAAKDAESLCRIVREPEIARFMHEWVERCPTVDKARAFIDAQQALKDAADIQARRWLAIALPIPTTWSAWWASVSILFCARWKSPISCRKNTSGAVLPARP